MEPLTIIIPDLFPLEKNERKMSEAEGELTAITPSLIEKATNSTANEVDPRLLSAIKSAARSSDAEIRSSLETLTSLLHRPHSQVRYLSLLIVDALFSRSRLFRSLLVSRLDLFLALTVGFRRGSPLPPPAPIALMLRSKSVEILERWNRDFGVRYPQIRLGFDYLKNTLKFQFPNRLENDERARRERREREERTKQILIHKFESLKENYDSIRTEIGSTVDEIGECLEIISVKDEVRNDNGEEAEFMSRELMQIRLDSLKEGVKIRESSENKAVFDAMRELYKLLVTKHLVSVQEWISVLVRVDLSDNTFRDAALKEFIDLRNVIKSVKKRCEELGCVMEERQAVKEEDEDLWEEGKIEICVPGDSVEEDRVDAPSTNKEKEKGKRKCIDDHDVGSSNSTSLRSKLLAKAPVMKWGPSFDDWGSTRDALANQRGLELDGHWGRVDPDAVIPAEKIAELKLHCTVYKEESSEIKPCLAPLKKGGLCQRRDLRVCPFHGPIIPRDADGNPMEQVQQTLGENREVLVDKESSFGKGKEVVQKLAKQAIKNVRERKRDINALKRAKREKVREHNEAVLREAATASTSYSAAFGENMECSVQGGNDVEAKKATLASMLKKKVTAKDRLAKRLLNVRSREDSSRQLTHGEDSKYREAFPNQW